jgi:hypothetical protein
MLVERERKAGRLAVGGKGGNRKDQRSVPTLADLGLNTWKANYWRRFHELIEDDPKALTLYRKETRHQGERSHLHNNVMEVDTPKQGNSKPYALSRLHDQRPDLHARVLAGELSPHAAMVEATTA